MTIEFRCEECKQTLVSLPERSRLGLAVAMLNLHLRKTGHDSFSASAEESQITIGVSSDPDGNRNVSATQRTN